MIIDIPLISICKINMNDICLSILGILVHLCLVDFKVFNQRNKEYIKENYEPT